MAEQEQKRAEQRPADGGPAFPSHGSMGEVVQEGLSLRDYFAAKALSGLLSMHGASVDGERLSVFKHSGAVAENAYVLADAMLAARSA